MTQESNDKRLSRARTYFTSRRLPLSPTFGMKTINPVTGVEQCWVPPGEWLPTRGKPVGSWTINPAITDPAVTSTLNSLKTLLLSAGIIN